MQQDEDRQERDWETEICKRLDQKSKKKKKKEEKEKRPKFKIKMSLPTLTGHDD